MADRTIQRRADLAQIGSLYRYHAPYGPDVCVYCGDPANSIDHVTPLSAIASMHDSINVREHFRHGLYAVPSCKDCNTRLGSFLARSIGEKREELKRRLRRKYSKLLGSYDWSSEEIGELGHSLQTYIQRQENRRARLLARLGFPQPWEATFLRAKGGR